MIDEYKYLILYHFINNTIFKIKNIILYIKKIERVLITECWDTCQE